MMKLHGATLIKSGLAIKLIILIEISGTHQKTLLLLLFIFSMQLSRLEF
jgi:hypothetical protein